MKFSDAIEEVRNRINIVDVIGQYVRLKRTGNNYMGLCPFHNEKTPSFSVSESKQIFKCFGCQKAGNVYTFLQEQEGLTFPEAVKLLAKRVNVTIEDEYVVNNELNKKKEILFKLYKDVANAYYTILYSDEGIKGREYFEYRNLTKETIKKFGLGYSPKSYGYMYKLMKEKGYEDSILMESKLFGHNANGVYDFFYGRVMFPLVDSAGNVVSFQGRTLGNGEPKYINTAESIIYRKSRNLFGINHAKLTKKDFFILCEGNMDVISLHQAGIDNAVASWGTAFTVEQANLIKRKVKKVILSQDTDAAGLKAIRASAEICEKAGLETYVVDYSPCKDADEFINKYGKEALLKKLENPISTFLFLISTLRKTYNLNNAYDYKKYIDDIVNDLLKIDNPLVRDKYIVDVANQESLSVTDLKNAVEKHKTYNITNSENVGIKIGNIAEDNNAEKNLMHVLVDNPDLRDKIKIHIKEEEINNKICRYIYNLYLNGADINKIIDTSVELGEDESNEVKDIIFSDKYKFNADDGNINVALNELIKKIKIQNIMNNNDNSLDKIFDNNNLINEIQNTKFIF